MLSAVNRDAWSAIRGPSRIEESWIRAGVEFIADRHVARARESENFKMVDPLLLTRRMSGDPRAICYMGLILFRSDLSTRYSVTRSSYPAGITIGCKAAITGVSAPHGIPAPSEVAHAAAHGSRRSRSVAIDESR